MSAISSYRRSAIGVALALLAGLSQASAQPENADRPPAFDPPDAVYVTGDDQEIDESRKRSLPLAQAYRAFLPVSADLTGRMPPVGRQGKLSSCTAWAVAYAARGYYASSYEGRDIRSPANVPSPSYVYHLSRGPDCGGTSIIKAVDVLTRGAPSLAAYPYADQCAAPPSADVVARASDFRVRGFSRVEHTRLDDLKGQLAQSNPVLISFADSPAFHRHRGDGVFEEPAFPGPNFGWHAMTMVGYDDRRQAFRLINSWGPGWGDRGYAWVSYDVIRTRVRAAGVLDVDRPTRPSPVAPSPPTPSPLPPIAVLPKPPPAPPPAPAPPPPRPQTATAPPPGPTAGPPRADLPELQFITCARVTAEEAGGRTVLAGFVASPADLDALRQAVAARPKLLLGEVLVAPWPQCEAMQTLDAALAVPDRPVIEVGPPSEPREGDMLRITIRTPAFPSYLYVSYVQVDGSLVHLVQPGGASPQPTPANRTLVLGEGRDGGPRITISAPVGREMIIAVASRRPLFAEQLPLRQTEREYLSMLRRALVFPPSAERLEGGVTAAVRAVETRAR